MSQAEFYVSPDGSDDWSGTCETPASDGSDGPFASLRHARDAVRSLIQAGLTRDVTVFVRGGTYEVASPIVYGPQDSPGERYSVVYAAYPGEEPVFCGAIQPGGWRAPRPEELPEGLSEEAAENVLVVDTRTHEELPEQVTTIYQGKHRLPRARGEGFVPVEPDDAPKDDKRTVHFPAGSMRDRPGFDGELVIRPNHPWVLNILPIDKVDEENGVARTTIPGTYALHRTWGRDSDEPTAWIENTPDVLTEPGEWLHCSRTGQLFLWPLEGKNTEEVRIAATQEILRIDGGGEAPDPIQNLTFRGLTFQQGGREIWGPEDVGVQHDWDMFDKGNALVRLRGAENCSVEHCRFRNSAGGGVRLDLHCQNNRLKGCRCEHLGGTGIFLCGFGPGHLDVNHHNDIAENHISRCGEIWWHAAGIFVWQSGHNRIANNLVERLPYNGIVVSGVRPGFFSQPDRRECGRAIRFEEIGEPGARDYSEILPLLHARHNVVEYNEVHDVMERMFDGNGIYISGTGPRNVIRCNYVHDIHACQAGIRTDDWQFETVLEGNVVCRCLNAGFILKGVNTIENNVVANLTRRRRGGRDEPVKGYVALRHTGENHPSSAGSRVRGNILYHDGPEAVFFEDERAPVDVDDLEVDSNLYYCASKPRNAEKYLRKRREEGIDAHSLAGDPMFADVDEDDFRLAQESPAHSLGICPIDVRETGPTGQNR